MYIKDIFYLESLTFKMCDLEILGSVFASDHSKYRKKLCVIKYRMPMEKDFKFRMRFSTEILKYKKWRSGLRIHIVELDKYRKLMSKMVCRENFTMQNGDHRLKFFRKEDKPFLFTLMTDEYQDERLCHKIHYTLNEIISLRSSGKKLEKIIKQEMKKQEMKKEEMAQLLKMSFLEMVDEMIKRDMSREDRQYLLKKKKQEMGRNKI